ncbi:SAM-dependent methyltransferase [Nonomuraea sp. NPDC050310]|uniref:SAM-dependent methyltransferase n=1 Tax=unclassified Nonomuraea TaxID=2593643 RepID=UPI00340FFF83
MSEQVPEGVDPSVPNVARMYDYYLGGKDNFASDRAAADQILRLFPNTRDSALENRSFLRRAVRHLVDSGVRQIVDLGSGLPTQGNTHETAPEARVVYVDYDAIVCAHARALLAGSQVSVVQADVRQPEDLLAKLGEHVDFSEPVGFVMLCLLHFIPDEPAYALTDRLREVSVPGSALVVSHAIDAAPDLTAEAMEIYRRSTAGLNLRTESQIGRFFEGYHLVEPGLVHPKDWRPEGEPEKTPPIGYAGVGFKA